MIIYAVYMRYMSCGLLAPAIRLLLGCKVPPPLPQKKKIHSNKQVHMAFQPVFFSFKLGLASQHLSNLKYLVFNNNRSYYYKIHSID